MEQKGSLLLRGNHMNYSRAVKTGNWHQAREAEPKDYDMNKAPVRDLCRSTYNLIGNVAEGQPLPMSTYTDMSTQVVRERIAYTEKQAQPMINEQTVNSVTLNRDVGKQQQALLPSHHPDSNKFHSETTYVADFGSPFPYTSHAEIEAPQPDHTVAYKRCLSQFTDTAGPRRLGRNTFQDESGIYANSYQRQMAPPYNSRRDPIAAAFQP